MAYNDLSTLTIPAIKRFIGCPPSTTNQTYTYDIRMISTSLKKSFFSGCSKMPLPSPTYLRPPKRGLRVGGSACPPQGFWRRGFAQAGRCKLSLAKSRSRGPLRSSGGNAYMRSLRYTPQQRRTCPKAGETTQMDIFQQSVRIQKEGCAMAALLCSYQTHGLFFKKS
jgi:hypothetical protein